MKHDEDFDGFLKKNLHNSSLYTNDAGFAEQVLQALPAKARSQRLPRLLAWAVGLLALAVLVPGLAHLSTALVEWINRLDLTQILQVGGLAFGVTLAAVLVWLAREWDLV